MILKKKTYVIDKKSLDKHFYEFHSKLNDMPLPILSINGEILKRDGFLIPTVLFPNPNTAEMIFNFKEIKSSHNHLSLTIVEYSNNKRQPIAYLFPNGSVFYTKNRSNSQIRKILKKNLKPQIYIRQQLVSREK